MEFRLFEILADFFDMLLSWSSTLFNWLFTDISILGYRFQPIYALPVVGIVFIVARIIDQFTGG